MKYVCCVYEFILRSFLATNIVLQTNFKTVSDKWTLSHILQLHCCNISLKSLDMHISVWNMSGSLEVANSWPKPWTWTLEVWFSYEQLSVGKLALKATALHQRSFNHGNTQILIFWWFNQTCCIASPLLTSVSCVLGVVFTVGGWLVTMRW